MKVYVLSVSTDDGNIKPKVFDSEEKAKKELARIYNDATKYSIYEVESSWIDKDEEAFEIEFKDHHMYATIHEVEVE